jgi:hypothetical protein
MSEDAQRYARFRRAWAMLASAAVRGDTVTYKQVGDEIGLFHRNVQPLCWLVYSSVLFLGVHIIIWRGRSCG